MSTTCTIQDTFATARQELCGALIERDFEIEAVMTALLCGENVLLVGPPGTAKSMLADAVCEWLDATKFALLLTKTTTTEELFGPISLKGLKADEFRRITTGRAPEAQVLFLDEIWKGSSAILNTLLQLLNEKTFSNGATVHQCPLLLCIAASNEWPSDQEGGKELGAMFDRFLIRRSVQPVASDKGLSTLLWQQSFQTALSSRITAQDVMDAQQEVLRMGWEPDAKEAFVQIVKSLRMEGVRPGDRRLRKSVTACAAYAYLMGDQIVMRDHLGILGDILWEDPAEQPKLVRRVVMRIASPESMEVNSLLMECEQVVGETQMGDPNSVVVAMKKLSEISKKLGKLTSQKAETAKEHVDARAKSIKLAWAESQ